MGEIFSLIWQDVDLNHGLIHIRNPKNNQTRQAYLTPDLKKMFKRIMPDNFKSWDLVFPGRNGKIIYQLSDSFDRAVADSGINQGVKDRQNKIVPHSLRHTFSSWLALQSESLLTIKELLGHRDIGSTQRYTHLLPDVKKQAVQKLGNRGKRINLEAIK